MPTPNQRMGTKQRRIEFSHDSVDDFTMKKKIRSFIAIPLAPGVRSNAIKLIRKLSESDDGIKWVPTDNLHLTLKFLGDVENTDVPDICNALSDICDQFEPFELNFRGTGRLSRHRFAPNPIRRHSRSDRRTR